MSETNDIASVESSIENQDGFKVPVLIKPVGDTHKDDTGQETAVVTQEKPPEKPTATLPPPLTTELPPEGDYFLEQMKNGRVVERIPLEKTRITFGRARDCDVPMDHPSLSRYHAAILWKNFPNSTKGFFYLMDLNSVHGSTLNKMKATASTLLRIDVNNNVIRFGGSSRLFMLGSNLEEDEQPERVERVASQTEEDPNACSWGMNAAEADDADLESSEQFSLLAKLTTLLNTPLKTGTTNEHVYKDASVKTLQQWFEREGYEFEYKVDFTSNKFRCSVDIPAEGHDVNVLGDPQAKKKEAIADACFKACKLLDRAEQLFPWQQQNQQQKRKQRHDSDEGDEIVDETEEAKIKRARKELLKSKLQQKTTEIATFETLKNKWSSLSQEIQLLKAKLVQMTASGLKSVESSNEGDSLESFMMTLSKGQGGSMQTKIEKSKLRMKVTSLEKEQQEVERLMKLAQPTFVLPALAPRIETVESKNNATMACDSETAAMQTGSTIEIFNESKSDFAKPAYAQKPAIALKKPKLAPNPFFSEECEQSDELKVSERPKVMKPERKPEPKRVSNMGVGSVLRQEKTQKKLDDAAKYESSEDFVDWVPPVNQSGDGKISLNEKLGY